jgi:hypothetical protein
VQEWFQVVEDDGLRPDGARQAVRDVVEPHRLEAGSLPLDRLQDVASVNLRLVARDPVGSDVEAVPGPDADVEMV